MQRYEHIKRKDGLKIFTVIENNFIREFFGLKPKVTEYIAGENDTIYYNKDTGKSIFDINENYNHYKLLQEYKNNKSFLDIKEKYNL